MDILCPCVCTYFSNFFSSPVYVCYFIFIQSSYVDFSQYSQIIFRISFYFSHFFFPGRQGPSKQDTYNVFFFFFRGSHFSEYAPYTIYVHKLVLWKICVRRWIFTYADLCVQRSKKMVMMKIMFSGLHAWTYICNVNYPSNILWLNRHDGIFTFLLLLLNLISNSNLF